MSVDRDRLRRLEDRLRKPPGRQAMVNVELQQPATHGDCAHADCDQRATHVLTLAVANVQSYTWVCDEHLGLFT